MSYEKNARPAPVVIRCVRCPQVLRFPRKGHAEAAGWLDISGTVPHLAGVCPTCAIAREGPVKAMSGRLNP